jgi:LytS/YehU family sensor histidine kinase
MKYKNESIKNEVLTSQIKALENELNPHFLFNALNSMSELVYLDPQKAEKSILDLSKFLRNAIKTDSLIDINSELEMVKTYVDIENIRFEDKIRLHISKKSVDKIMVPKFSIQLLVENAIKHGFGKKPLNIEIDIGKDIQVSNDGKRIEELTFGTGLTNLDYRLKLLKVGRLVFEKNDDKTRFKIEVKNENIDRR